MTRPGPAAKLRIWPIHHVAIPRKAPGAASYETMSGIPLRAVYRPEDVAALRGDRRPRASIPYTRGVHATMYRGKPWTMRMFAGFGTPEDTNQRFKFLLEQGQTGLSTAFDMPTLMGYDPDHPRSLGEVGREGVSVASLDDMERLFDDIPLDKVTTSMTINAPAVGAAGALRRASPRSRASRPTSCAARCRTTCSRSSSRRRSGSAPIRAPHAHHPRHARLLHRARCRSGTPISISGYHIREAGATAVQELAFTLADGIGYVRARHRARASTSTTFAPRLSFFLDVHNDFFEEIAKFRAGAPDVGAASCASASAPRTRARGCCARTRRPPACR